MAPVRERLGWRTAGQALERPPDDREVMARSLLYKFAGGALLVSIALAMAAPGTDVRGLGACAGIAWLLAGLLLWRFDELPDWGYPALVAAGTLLVTGAIAFAGADNVVYPMFYLWISLSAFYFFPARIAHAQLAVVGVGYALTGVSADRWLIVVGTVWLAGTLIGLLRRRTELLVAQLGQAAITDPLTGLLNHRGFEERLETMLAQSNRSGREFTLAIGDLDGFKRVNDRLGHLAGDDVLRRLAPLLRDALRAGDSVGRLGGDEFALLFDGSDDAEAYLVVERVRSAVASAFADDMVRITVSFGLAAWPDHGGSARALLYAADHALYAAKGLGRDRSVIYSDQLRRPDLAA
jgi:diguanylate cyclase (GGDEF)-like protein